VIEEKEWVQAQVTAGRWVEQQAIGIDLLPRLPFLDREDRVRSHQPLGREPGHPRPAAKPVPDVQEWVRGQRSNEVEQRVEVGLVLFKQSPVARLPLEISMSLGIVPSLHQGRGPRRSGLHPLVGQPGQEAGEERLVGVPTQVPDQSKPGLVPFPEGRAAEVG
jgi:hypothetical protein